MTIKLFDALGQRAIGEVSRRKANALLRRREAARVLDSRRREIGIRLRPVAPHWWTPVSGGMPMFGCMLNRASGAKRARETV